MAAETHGQFVTLTVDGETFGIAVDEVSEILAALPVTAVPNAPHYLAGLIDVRGRSVPVIDLRLKLGLPAVPATELTRILVLEVDLGGTVRTLGLRADRVSEVTELDGGQLEDPPEIGIRWRSDYIRGVGRVDGAFVIVLNLGRLLGTEEAALLPAA
jgi:purine-binding chemotaxis protein CheW